MYITVVYYGENQGDETMDNQQERLEVKKAWFVGFFEAEGWICLMKVHQKYKNQMVERYVPLCGICNTDFTILKLLESLLNDEKIGYHLALIDPRKKGYKKLWRINFSGLKRCSEFLNWIIPFILGEKLERAEKILKFCEMRKEKTTGFNGISYSKDEIDLYQEILLKSPTTTRRALKSDDIV